MIRTRRLFTKLNRYAKPTDNRTNIAIDEDDCIAISTRRLVRELDVLKGIIKIDAAGKQLSTGKKDAKYFTTMATLYECNLELAKSFRDGSEMAREFLSSRPSDEYLDDIYAYLSEIWTHLMNSVDLLRRITQDKELPGEFRSSDGGAIWVRPLFQLIACQFLKRALLSGHGLTPAVEWLSKLPRNLNDEPWVNVLWNPGTKRIAGAKAERMFCVEALVISSGMGNSNMTKKDLKEKYGHYHNRASKDFPSF